MDGRVRFGPSGTQHRARAETPAPDAISPGSRVAAARQRRHSASHARLVSVNSALSNGLSAHILPTSATMIGVCMTVVSIVKLVHLSGIGVVIDRVLAADSIVFLLSAMLSFTSMQRTEGAARLERWAEMAFVFALGLVAVAAVILAFEIG
jgi:hypothetical protein